ncbi:MAG TPA: hypothetical protein VGB49_07800 [Caulobacteraceae bacterium]|jgi:hypothetical protein
MIRAGHAALIALIALPLLGGCVIVADGAQDRPIQFNLGEPGPGAGELEAIYAAAFTDDRAVIRVSSNGCTGKDSFQAVLSRNDGQEPLVTLRRLSPDNCRALVRDGVELTWTYAELGLAPGETAQINNPFLLR